MAKHDSIAPKKDGKNSTAHYAIGIIDYLPVRGDPLPQSGVLLYIKNSLTGDEEAQVLGQKAIDVAFPHDTTLNQFFNETQFEAYRELGEHLGSFIWNQFLTATATTPKESPKGEDESRRQIRDFFEGFLRNEWKNAKESKQESEYDLIRTLLDGKRNQI